MIAYYFSRNGKMVTNSLGLLYIYFNINDAEKFLPLFPGAEIKTFIW